MRQPPHRLSSPDRAQPAALPERRASRTHPHHGVELSWLGRYAIYAGLAAVCAMVAVWSRIEMRNLAMEMDKAHRAFGVAQAEQDRLQLELATLRDPRVLSERAQAMELVDTVQVIELPAGDARP